MIGPLLKQLALAAIIFIGLPNRMTSELLFSTHKLSLLVNETNSFSVSLSQPVKEVITVQLVVKNPTKIKLSETSFNILPSNDGAHQLEVTGLSPGLTTISANVSRNAVSTMHAVTEVYVQHSVILSYVSFVIGWLYFAAWSISFYPQLYTNYTRKSVVGLNFDFLMLNLIGFTLYSAFNLGLYFSPTFQEEYFQANPGGLIPVEPADIFFSVHATIITLFTIFQCFIYERRTQRVSYTALGLVSIYAVILVVSACFTAYSKLTWLDFLYICSYIKLSITLIKYIPQAYMNYQRKSTMGWSIGNIILDFTGGTLSMGQMLINGYNYDDWKSIFGDPTKFGLGFFSVVFDIFFMIQHYVLYRGLEPYEPLPGTDTENSERPNIPSESPVIADENDCDTAQTD
nr:PREDICTED: cystinosin homolog isoform X1 [Bemisia tabaci]XP_018915762.1 PREDICTED: cystinosin homolog isoform X1 [Bemisia tabaci]XP_018915763.1 PREDICTED: cystinosin homolog isoform X1 [Bemisia tabaci]XP_018915764.1 PREDICTED: cystinosin homolog isoform X1 [Bemisia tabaci]XP_018915765.1 PREDICTED: cystinosin homolog isoform X1 [Bemisia tabaci]